jgi:hypothetical protein
VFWGVCWVGDFLLWVPSGNYFRTRWDVDLEIFRELALKRTECEILLDQLEKEAVNAWHWKTRWESQKEANLDLIEAKHLLDRRISSLERDTETYRIQISAAWTKETRQDRVIESLKAERDKLKREVETLRKLVKIDIRCDEPQHFSIPLDLISVELPESEEEAASLFPRVEIEDESKTKIREEEPKKRELAFEDFLDGIIDENSIQREKTPELDYTSPEKKSKKEPETPVSSPIRTPQAPLRVPPSTWEQHRRNAAYHARKGKSGRKAVNAAKSLRFYSQNDQ